MTVNIWHCVVLLVGYGSKSYTGYELSRFIEVDIAVSGGLSAIPISVMVNATDISATGKEY